VEPQLKRLYDQGLRLFNARPASANAYVRAGQQTRLVLPDGSQANFIAQTDINGGIVEVAITEQGEGLAWCSSASSIANQRLADLRRERPTVDALVPTEVRRVAMVLDSNWVYGFPGFTPTDAPTNINFLKLLLQGTSTVFTLPIDSRVLVEFGGVFGPLADVGAAMAAAVGVSVVAAPLDKNVNGFIWLPLLNFGDRYTETELAAIQRCGNDFGALLIGERTTWAGDPSSYNGHLIELFDPSIATTNSGTGGDRANLDTAVGVVEASGTSFWDAGTIAAPNILGTLVPQPDFPNDPPPEGAVGAAWLTGSE
jgi:hypothetical protein